MLQVLRTRTIGECIYCGSINEPLQTEHTVPYGLMRYGDGLNEDVILHQASCSACALITIPIRAGHAAVCLPADANGTWLANPEPARAAQTIAPAPRITRPMVVYRVIACGVPSLSSGDTLSCSRRTRRQASHTRHTTRGRCSSSRRPNFARYVGCGTPLSCDVCGRAAEFLSH